MFVCLTVCLTACRSDCLSGCRSVGSRVFLTICPAVFLRVCWLQWACTRSLGIIFGSYRRCQGSILEYLGSPGLHFEASWAPFWWLWDSLGHLGGPLNPQGCPVIALSLILASFWSHFGTILEAKLGSTFKYFFDSFFDRFFIDFGSHLGTYFASFLDYLLMCFAITLKLEKWHGV